jgi:type IV pilus assembly protein PilA
MSYGHEDSLAHAVHSPLQQAPFCAAERILNSGVFLMKSVQKGFTLIELMIVVAIIGILAAIAIPAYMNYTIRAQVSEGNTLVDGLETAFDECYANKGTAANCATNTAVGVNNVISGQYVTGVTFTAPGQITVVYGNNANAKILGKDITWTAYASPNGDITWVCAGEAVAPVPAGAVIVNGGTTAAVGAAPMTNNAYLPTVCQ